MESCVPQRLLAMCSDRAPALGAAAVFLTLFVLSESDQQSNLLTAALIAAAGLLGLHSGGQKKVNAGAAKAAVAKKALHAEGVGGRGSGIPERAARAAGGPRAQKPGGDWGPFSGPGVVNSAEGDDKKLKAAMRSLEHDADLSPTSYAAAMDVCNRRGFTEIALKVFDLMLEKGVAHQQHLIDRRTSVSFFKLVVHNIGDERLRSDGLRLLDAIRAHGLSPAVGAQDHLIVAWRSKLPEHVVGYFVKMREEGLVLSWTAYRCVMSAYQWKDPGFTLALYDELTGQGVRPDRVHFNAALTAYCELGRMDQAFQLLRDGPSLRVEPNAQSYQIVIRACTSNGHEEEALAFFKTLREGGICPYRATYHDAVLCCVKLERYEDAAELCNGMHAPCQRPCEDASSFLKRMCQKHGWTEIAAHIAEDVRHVRKTPVKNAHR